MISFDYVSTETFSYFSNCNDAQEKGGACEIANVIVIIYP